MYRNRLSKELAATLDLKSKRPKSDRTSNYAVAFSAKSGDLCP